MKLNLKNPIVFFDLETTGTNINSCLLYTSHLRSLARSANGIPPKRTSSANHICAALSSRCKEAEMSSACPISAGADSEKALHCVRCGKCEAVCPQKLPIRDSLAQLQKELDAL